MYSGQLTINRKSISIEEIQKRIFPGSLSPYEKNTLEFCAEWLNKEKEYFTVQTSGSTGIPKEIKLSRKQMIRSAEMTRQALGLKENDHALVCLNTSYIAGKMMIVRSFVIGMNITIIDPASDPLLSLSKNERFDFTAMVPLQIENCLNHASEKISILNGMKAILVGGAPVSSSLEKKIERISSPVLLTFGMTETISHVALRRLNGERKEGYYRALEEVKFEKDNRECLIIHSPLSEEPVITNDVVQLLSKDKFIWKGRFDNVINSGGIKVHPETVESKLQKIFEEANLNIPFFVAGMLDEKLGEKVCLFVEGEKLSEKEKEKILRMFPHRELGYESPRQCYFIKRFEYTESGKVKRKESMKLNLQL